MTHLLTPQSLCRAGLARADITPPVGIYHRMWGAAAHDRATGVHRPLLATALWLAPRTAEKGPSAGRLLLALDHCILDGPDLAQLRQQAAAAAGLAPEQVLITLSHTHGSGWISRTRAELPGGELIAPYFEGLGKQLAELAAAAVEHAQDAAIVYGAGKCDLAAHRDFFDAGRGRFVCGLNPSGVADDALLVARIDAADGRPLGTLVNYACHPTTLAWDNTLLSPDYVGALRETVESQFPGPCLFLQGASGDLGPREGFVGDPAIADRNGRQVGFAALSALTALPAAGTRFAYAGPVVSGTLIGAWRHEPLDEPQTAAASAWQLQQAIVPLAYRADLPTRAATAAERADWQAQEQAARGRGDEARSRECRARVEQMTRQLARLNALPEGPAYPFPVTAWRLGDALWALVPAELYQAFQQTLRRELAPTPVIVATLTNDWQPGYLPPRDSFGQGIYQAEIASLGPGCLETVTAAAVRLLRQAQGAG